LTEAALISASRNFVASGQVASAHRTRICDEQGNALPWEKPEDRHPGENVMVLLENEKLGKLIRGALHTRDLSYLDIDASCTSRADEEPSLANDGENTVEEIEEAIAETALRRQVMLYNDQSPIRWLSSAQRSGPAAAPELGCPAEPRRTGCRLKLIEAAIAGPGRRTLRPSSSRWLPSAVGVLEKTSLNRTGS
jgi:hypothetical protein